MLIDDPHSPGLARLIERVSPEQARDDLDDALSTAKELVQRGLDAAKGWRLGDGHGPIDAFARFVGR